MEDKLTEINKNELGLLRDLYDSERFEKNYMSFMAIDNYMSWFKQNPGIKHIRFFCLNGNLSNGTFIVTDRCIAHTNTLKESSDELHRLLMMVDFSKGFCFFGLNDHVAAVVRETIKKKQVNTFSDECYMQHYLHKETALKFDVRPPEGIELKSVTEFRDIKSAYDKWSGSKRRLGVKLLERAATYGPSCGAFLNDGSLVAWVFRLPVGMILALQTETNYHGRGYGTLVAKTLCKKIADSEHDCYAGIFEHNVASRAVFKKLGFTMDGRVHTICTDIHWTEADDS